MKLKTMLLLYIITCISFSFCTFSPDINNQHMHSGEEIKTDSFIAYIHQYDTLFHGKYSYNPDSLYNVWVTCKTIKKDEEDGYKLIAHSPQGKCFLKKMEAVHAYSQLRKKLNLPGDAYIIETKKITAKDNSNRLLILWMIDPYVYIDYESAYTCPEYTRGKAYFEGKTFLSLVSYDEKQLINTVEMRMQNDYTVTDTVGNKIIHTLHAENIVPVSALERSRAGGAMSGKYFTTHSTDSTDGPVEILHLEDYNQDGKAYEFALFENFFCAGTSCTLYGYSHIQDKVIQYAFETTYQADVRNDLMEIVHADTVYTETTYWVDALFTSKPKKFPVTFSIDYRGRGGDYNHYVFNYNKEKELFIETVDSRSRKEDEHTPSSWIPVMQ